jgi:hypothetical protein
VETVNEFVDCMKGMVKEARAALTKTKEDMARYYNQQRMLAPMYSPGDKVFLDASNIKTTCPSPKPLHHYIGPFPVVRTVRSHTYHLKLPTSMNHIHLTFHVVKLLPAPQDPIPG